MSPLLLLLLSVLQTAYEAMLRSVKEIDSNSKWRIMEPMLRLYPQFFDVEDERERQRLFEDYVEVCAAVFYGRVFELADCTPDSACCCFLLDVRLTAVKSRRLRPCSNFFELRLSTECRCRADALPIAFAAAGIVPR